MPVQRHRRLQRRHSSSRSRQEFHLGFGTRTRGTSTSQNWSTGQSWADGTSWSDASSTQRVYEYTVEPSVLQNLPDRALLLALPGSAGPQLQPVECDPAIADLPGVSPQWPVQRPVPTRGEDAPVATGGASSMARIMRLAAQGPPVAPAAGTASPAGPSSRLTEPVGQVQLE